MPRGDIWVQAGAFPLRVGPWLASLRSRRDYRFVDERELAGTRRSETLFVFGSGWSLNEHPDAAWRHFAQHDTLGFNWFVHQRFVRCDYHLIRGIPDTDRDPRVWRRQLGEYFALIRENPRFDDTIFLVHGGFGAINGNRALGFRYLPEGRRVFRWKSNVTDSLPSRSFAGGLVHGVSTLQECINFGYLLGWRRIVLVGVDLYDRRYFWLPPEETRSVDVRRGATAADVHNRGAHGLVEALATWHEWLEREGVELAIQNPRSMLAAVLPVYEAPAIV